MVHPRTSLLVASLVGAALAVAGCGDSPTTSMDTMTIEVQADPAAQPANKLVMQVGEVTTTMVVNLPPGGIVSVKVARPAGMGTATTVMVQVTATGAMDCVVGEFNGPVSTVGSKIVIKLSAVTPPRCATAPGQVGGGDGGGGMPGTNPDGSAGVQTDAPMAMSDVAVSPPPPDGAPPPPDTMKMDVPPAPPTVCGNGAKDPGEACDPLAANPADRCPDVCPTTNCTTRKLINANTCQAQCVDDVAQTQCRNGDGCCPAGCNASNDDSCPIKCGNGVLEAGETCDPMTSCPQSCPNNRCEVRELVNAGTCQAECRVKETISACITGDNCCPMGCSNLDDKDCPANCDNGKIEADETCDPRSTCPATCPNVACQKRKKVGADCSVQCVPDGEITACANNDGCCPSGCNNTNDNDCAPVCGNLVREGDELCDPGSGTECPQGCPPLGCMKRELKGKDQCHSSCQPSDTITECIAASDGCCPSSCHRGLNEPGYDSDCLPRCGNAVLEDIETCEHPAPGKTPPAKNCQTEFDNCKVDKDNDDKGSGSVANCTFTCMHVERQCDRMSPEQTMGDGFCPTKCSWIDDPDCKKAAGDSCMLAMGECQTGLSCTNGRCCQVASCGECQVCTGSGGTCQAAPNGMDPNGLCDPSTKTCEGGICKLQVNQPGCPMVASCVSQAICLSMRCCPAASCAAGQGTVCGASGCTDTGACIFPGATTSCGNTVCASASQLGVPKCNGAGGCVHETVGCGFGFKCQPGAGMNADAFCPTMCTKATEATDCLPGFECTGGACKKKAGEECSMLPMGNNECSSGNCLGGICCSSPMCVTGGTCGAAACAASNSPSPGACVYPTTATTCGDAASCTGNNEAQASTCNGAGACVPTVTQCSPYKCKNGACPTTCSNPSDCASSDFQCTDNQCKKKNGIGCSVGGECASSVCKTNCCASCTGLTDPVCGPTTCAADSGACGGYPGNEKKCGTETPTCVNNKSVMPVCNGSGSCGTSETTCAPGQRCQASTGLCPAGNLCTTDEHCLEGLVCNTMTGACTSPPPDGG